MVTREKPITESVGQLALGLMTELPPEDHSKGGVL